MFKPSQNKSSELEHWYFSSSRWENGDYVLLRTGWGDFCRTWDYENIPSYHYVSIIRNI